MHSSCLHSPRLALHGRVCLPLIRRSKVAVRCKPDEKEDNEKLVKEAVKQLRGADVDQASAREMMKMWKEVRSFIECCLCSVCACKECVCIEYVYQCCRME